MNIQTLKGENMTVRYFRFGNPDGKPMLIIAGVAVKSVMESAQFIAKQYEMFSEDYNIYVIDRRSDMPEKYSISEMADDTAEAMRIIGIEKCYIYGVSQGGMIAQVIALKYPELVKKLVLCSTSAYVTESAERVIDEWIELSENNEKEKLMFSFAKNVYTESYAKKYHNAFVTLSKIIEDEDLKRFVITVKAIRGFDIRENLGEIKCPVLATGGGKDLIFGRETSLDIAERTNGEMYIYEEYAHGVYDENHDIIPRIKTFFDL